MRFLVFVVGMLLMVSVSAQAADWQWPEQMTIGGFRITDISGSISSDGSGSAAGALQIPSLGSSRINLSRTARGEISGAVSLSTRSVSGSFKLTDRGLQGHGTVECSPRSIDSSSVEITPKGEAKGNGRVSLGRLSVGVDFNVTASSCSVDGSAPIKIQADTAVATYKFDGKLELAGGGGRMLGSVSGRVERTGKLTDQTTSFNIPKTSVDMSNGQCVVNVGGVSVTFNLF
ncbi:MAG: hypothetical protein ACOX3G_11215 [Armatimonadota bacterium]|jgi:hypothetical protein